MRVEQDVRTWLVRLADPCASYSKCTEKVTERGLRDRRGEDGGRHKRERERRIETPLHVQVDPEPTACLDVLEGVRA